MGFKLTGLGPGDSAAILQLSPDIVTTLRKAATLTGQGGGRAQSLTWFGDNSPGWMQSLSQQLGRLASLINLQTIDVSFSPWKERDGGEFAAARMPRCGWKNLTEGHGFMTKAQNQGYYIILNERWNTTPMYRPPGQPADSKFQTIVHECTHLFLNTDDDGYGVMECRQIAAGNMIMAKKTADNWGYFVEEFR